MGKRRILGGGDGNEALHDQGPTERFGRMDVVAFVISRHQAGAPI
jgi:hypothetical protein